MFRQPDAAILINRSFRIVDEGAGWLIVEKPAHLLIHPTRPDGGFTLWKGLREMYAFEIACGGQISIINRLDRETSGLVLAAKDHRSARFFCGLMESHLIKKSYLAVVFGWPEEDVFTADEPILRQGDKTFSAIWVKQMVHPDGAVARTDFQVLQRLNSAMGKVSVVAAIPRTGRTHQIRVHLSHLGFPVIGDKIYGSDENLYLEFIETGWTDRLASILHLPRHALHSASLEVSGIGSWNSDLPWDLEACLG